MKTNKVILRKKEEQKKIIQTEKLASKRLLELEKEFGKPILKRVMHRYLVFRREQARAKKNIREMQGEIDSLKKKFLAKSNL